MAKRVSVHDRFRLIREKATASGSPCLPDVLQGISKARIEQVLTKVDRCSRDLVDCVFALLDDAHESFKGFKLSDGASTAHLGAHIAFLQRDNDIKLDREGRDYWIKPLAEIGAVEEVTLVEGNFLAGHVVAKSPNSSYRLNKEFLIILKAPEDEWEQAVAEWISADATRRRLEMQAKAVEESRRAIDTGHKHLIAQSISQYAKRFLPGFQVLYVDDSDGTRISDEEKRNLQEAGITLRLGDAFPDVLLWNPATDKLWCIEAVTSDGEVDARKVEQLTKLAERHGKQGIGFTTAYQTWKSAASRQDGNRNLAIGSFVWIASDPSKQLEVQTFTSLLSSSGKNGE